MRKFVLIVAQVRWHDSHHDRLRIESWFIKLVDSLLIMLEIISERIFSMGSLILMILVSHHFTFRAQKQTISVQLVTIPTKPYYVAVNIICSRGKPDRSAMSE
jgi:hypothetical protein